MYNDWTPEKKSQFLASLRTEPNVTVAARAAGQCRSGAYALRERDSAFAKLWDEALEEGIDALESEMHRRAFSGTDKPVTFQGAITATYKEYSDTLAIFLAKAHRPERFRDRSTVDLNVTDVTARIVAARARGEAPPESLV